MNDLTRTHVREVHRHGYDCQWEGCDKVFPRKALLLRHHKIHTGEKAFICPVEDCVYTTNHKSNLERHRATHSKNDRMIDAAVGIHNPTRGHIETTESINLRRRLALRQEVMARSTRVLGEVILR